MKLVLDIEASQVLVGPHKLQNQWLDFYALLALSRADKPSAELFLSADRVGRTGVWRHKVTASVGKEIARHLAWLDEHELGQLIGSQGKTRAWRLNLPAKAIVFHPSQAAVQAWLDSRSTAPAEEQNWVNDLQRLVSATLLTQQGQGEPVLQDLEQALSSTTEPSLLAWGALLRGRAAVQQDEEELLSELCDIWIHRSDGPGKTVGAKLRSSQAFRNRGEAPEAVLHSLTRLASDLEMRGDTAALGSVLNVMGLLLRRTGDPKTAVTYLLRAAALTGIVGDYWTLQGTLFNLAICRRDWLTKERRPVDEDVFHLVELSRLVCKSFNIGNDSAQSEIAAAQWALETGDAKRARFYLREAEYVVKRVDTLFEQASFLFARARVEHASPDGNSNPIKDLRTAERMFEEIGERKALTETRRLLKLFNKGLSESF